MLDPPHAHDLFYMDAMHPVDPLGTDGSVSMMYTGSQDGLLQSDSQLQNVTNTSEHMHKMIHHADVLDYQLFHEYQQQYALPPDQLWPSPSSRPLSNLVIDASYKYAGTPETLSACNSPVLGNSLSPRRSSASSAPDATDSTDRARTEV
jgi:hypothetical protein